MTRFDCVDLPLAGLKLVTRQRVGDQRGFLSRIFCAEDLTAAGWQKPVAQINHTFTAKLGTVRGLHFQHPPCAEMKLVNCLRGEVWDVAVDLRAHSNTYLQWHAQILSADNGQAMLIPEGFAHGFQTLTDDVEMLYCHSVAYNATSEAGLNIHDERLAIMWPLPVAEVSVRDAGHPLIANGFKGVHL